MTTQFMIIGSVKETVLIAKKSNSIFDVQRIMCDGRTIRPGFEWCGVVVLQVDLWRTNFRLYFVERAPDLGKPIGYRKLPKISKWGLPPRQLEGMHQSDKLANFTNGKSRSCYVEGIASCFYMYALATHTVGPSLVLSRFSLLTYWSERRSPNYERFIELNGKYSYSIRGQCWSLSRSRR